MAASNVIRLPRREARAEPRSWAITQDGLSTALALCEEYALPLRIRLYNGAIGQDFNAADYSVRCAEPIIQLIGPQWCVSVDLRRTHRIRAIRPISAQAPDHLRLQCEDNSQRPLMIVSCSTAPNAPEVSLWHQILKALA
ncbi:MAG: hypothetical protein ACPG4N_07950 [Gammaproteobacteria bacterium]